MFRFVLALFTLISFLFLAQPIFAFEERITEEEVSNGLQNTDSSLQSSREREPVGLSMDRYFSPHTGSELMLTLLRGYQMVDDQFASTLGDTTSTAQLTRGVKLIAENLLFMVGNITQHEIFGHGFRAREYHMPVSYQIRLSSGLTSFSQRDYDRLSFHEKTALSAAGMEADSILASTIRKRWIKSKLMDVREAHFYLLASLDQTLYVLDARKHEKENNHTAGHDVIHYVTELNNWHGKQVITTSSLRGKVLMDFLDPYFFYSLYSIGQYLSSGTPEFDYPMIAIGEYQYLPAARIVLAPYGPEYQWMNFIRAPERDYIVNLRLGHTGGLTSSALDLTIQDIFTSELLSLDAKMSLWHQPKLFTAIATGSPKQFGTALSIGARYRLADKIELTGELGYKTTGYVPGEILKHTPLLRLGFRAFL